MRFQAVSWLLPALLAWAFGPAAAAQPPAGTQAEAAKSQKPSGAKRAARKQRGKASYYGRQFSGKKMADGTPMNPRADIAASKTLPLGTKAEVKNLETGKKAVVEIRDRGPYVEGRIIDVSPKVAEDLDMKKDGVAPVEVTPIEIPPPRGTPEDGR
jgi:rare lipoprotein A